MDYEQLKTLIAQRGVHAVFGEYGEGFGIEQNATELARFLVHMQQLGVTSILEVGTGWKAGLARFLHDDLGWRVTSVDIQNYGHVFGGIDFVHPRDFDYHAVDERYDLVLLDADHTYNAVKDQHAYYAQFATKVIAFHDIAGLRDCEGVRDYWNEIAYLPGREDMGAPLKSGHYELIANTDQRGGIGYIVLEEANAEPEPETEAPKTEAKKSAPRKRTPAKPKATAKK